jgi:drug/metabolite transporter (DMT)-like permease
MSVAKLVSLITGVVVTGTIRAILGPIMTTIYPSLFFLVFLLIAESVVIFGIILLGIHLYNRRRIRLSIPPYPSILILLGLCCAVMVMCLLYATNPTRTPVFLQSILVGLVILPCVLFTWLILRKHVIYNLKFTLPSILLLLIALGISVIPLVGNAQFEPRHAIWIMVFLIGVIFLGLANVLVEKYMTMTDTSFENNIRLAFYSNLVQFIGLICLSWLDIFMGYSFTASDAFYNFTESFELSFKAVPVLLLTQAYIFDGVVLMIFSTFLNSISTNYNMILINVTNQLASLFFVIFPGLNFGIKYPTYIVLPSLFCVIVSVILWIKGENKQGYDDTGTDYDMEMTSIKTEPDEKTRLYEVTEAELRPLRYYEGVYTGE